MEEQVFDRLWVEAWKDELVDDNKSVQAAELIVRLAHLRDESTLVDFGCGIGRIAHALTCFGIRVTGIERSFDALFEAKRKRNDLCRFFCCDWREYKPDQPFDCAIFWFTTLCGGNERDIETLRVAYRALKPNGTLLIETRHWDRAPRQFETRSERGPSACRLTEQHSYDPETGTQTTEEHFSVGTRTVLRAYQTRRYRVDELQAMCAEAGFHRFEAFDESGFSLSGASNRMILRASRI